MDRQAVAVTSGERSPPEPSFGVKLSRLGLICRFPNPLNFENDRFSIVPAPWNSAAFLGWNGDGGTGLRS
jgi:hypothetical protein